MLVLDYSFPTSYTPKVETARDEIERQIGATSGISGQSLSFPLDLKEGLEIALKGGVQPAPVIIRSRAVTIAYDNRRLQPSQNPPPPDAYTAGTCIWLCERTFQADQSRLNAVLLHELVHVLCGLELDAETFENLLFPNGATPPDEEDIKAFARRNWRGRWVRVIDADPRLLMTNYWGGTVLEWEPPISTNIRNIVQTLGLQPIPNA